MRVYYDTIVSIIIELIISKDPCLRYNESQFDETNSIHKLYLEGLDGL